MIIIAKIYVSLESCKEIYIEFVTPKNWDELTCSEKQDIILARGRELTENKEEYDECSWIGECNDFDLIHYWP